jgi:SAM-dependent methyltransferase
MESTVYTGNFEASRGGHWWFVARTSILRALLGRLELPGSPPRILDFGAGTGANLPLLAEFGAVEGVDPSEHARRLASQDGFEVRDPDDVTEDDVYALVTAIDVLEHVQHDTEAVRSLAAHLAPDGVLLVTVPALPVLWNHNDLLSQHHRRYTARSLRHCLEAADLTVDHLTYFNSALLPVAAAAAVRDFRRARQTPTAAEIARGSAYLEIPPAPVNRLLRAVMEAETPIHRRGGRLPIGISLAAIAARSSEAGRG